MMCELPFFALLCGWSCSPKPLGVMICEKDVSLVLVPTYGSEDLSDYREPKPALPTSNKTPAYPRPRPPESEESLDIFSLDR